MAHSPPARVTLSVDLVSGLSLDLAGAPRSDHCDGRHSLSRTADHEVARAGWWAHGCNRKYIAFRGRSSNF